MHPRDVKKIDVIHYRNWIDEQQSAATVNRKLAAISSIFRELVDEEVVDKNPVVSVRRIPQTKIDQVRPTQAFTDQEIQNIIQYFKEAKPTLRNLNYQTIFLFLAYTGARVSEILKIKVQDFYQKEGLNFVKIHGKGRKERELGVNKNLEESIKEIIERRGMKLSDYLFTSTYVKKKGIPVHRTAVHKELKKVLKILNLEPNRASHSFRRGVIRGIEKKHGIYTASLIAGHSNTKITEAYLDPEIKAEENPLFEINYSTKPIQPHI